MKSIFKFLSAAIVLTFVSCQSDDSNAPSALDNELSELIITNAATNGALEDLMLPDSDDYDRIPQDPKNPITKEKVELGKFLFHETGLAQNPSNEIGRGTYSCASCHNAQGGFQSGRFQGIGEGGIGFGLSADRDRHLLYKEKDLDVQPIRTPSSLNIAYHNNVLWNGQFGATGLNTGTESAWTAGTPKEKNNLGYEGTEIQAIAGLDVHRMIINETLINDLGYKALFDRAFSDWPESNRYTTETAGLAIAAYERIQLANKAPFQQWLRGQYEAMTPEEKQGAISFFGKAECSSCHNGPSLANMEFHAIGMGDLFSCPEEVFKTTTNDPETLGRGGFTGNAEDNYKFKVPTLYNLKDSPFYGHGSTFNSIKDVLDYKNLAEQQNMVVPESALSEHFKPLNLSEEEIRNLEMFITRSLYDADLARYVPEDLLSGNCFPNADLLSQEALGCR